MGRQSVVHADHVQASIARSDAAHSALVASWRRSLQLHRLDPAERKAPRRLTEAELMLARQRMEPLARAAEASLNRLYLAVGGVGCCVMLADRNGIPIERRGAVADDETFDEWGLWTGTVWSEDAEGTNGIGTCIAEQRALTIHRDQHFFSRNTLLSCTTAPVYDHEGNLAAALDVSSCRSDLTEGFVQLIAVAVGDAARRIEAENFRMVYSSARILLAPVAERGAGAFIAVDADDLVVGATRTARLALGITREALAKGLLAADLLGDAAKTSEDLDDAERGVVQRAIARTGGNVSAAAQNLGISRATLHRKLARFGIHRTH
ncbi:sigma-54-dependent Fis family transcriptional regulator [Mesorhizobium sp. M4B.F.Ca.ET.143.01.1.1]|nr:sigma-54-dependent Fis family transcriptional regulator [Mesorhizobium sp. M4B.F.Ca.ET.049.02.1.2]RVD23458.1 sigma-54-dependent Fis family transcriptional regulator [Mesorhizobium sp. M4B.F.Ca.ET.017.02.2.1]TGV26545.1 sigma-54-dependent Fis family transcriptional regulator [Mesorhizobium sp. M4B.F.Ca.ET.143.01.1.1]